MKYKELGDCQNLLLWGHEINKHLSSFIKNNLIPRDQTLSLIFCFSPPPSVSLFLSLSLSLCHYLSLTVTISLSLSLSLFFYIHLFSLFLSLFLSLWNFKLPGMKTWDPELSSPNFSVSLSLLFVFLWWCPLSYTVRPASPSLCSVTPPCYPESAWKPPGPLRHISSQKFQPAMHE